MNDVLRYTMVTADTDDLVGHLERLVACLEDRAWTVTDAHHSYVDGSRYKGIHANLRTPSGVRVELQFHSAASAAVKSRTTRISEIPAEAQQTVNVRGGPAFSCPRSYAHRAASPT